MKFFQREKIDRRRKRRLDKVLEKMIKIGSSLKVIDWG